ncbi:hypothetical protein [Terrabacter sp. 2RAF25]|uniref:hypothetical protein n=1 Tax=Terrabacter sp. 2RAF25 TaxID=3232998 RepID=UPI003F99F835
MSSEHPQTPSPSASSETIRTAIDAARTALADADAEVPSAALPLLRIAQEHVTAAIDEAMAAVLVSEGGTIRTAGALAGLSENAVGPRLARTRLLAAYGSDAGRVTAAGVERARYDLEEGRHREAPDQPDQPKPMRFRARRTTT